MKSAVIGRDCNIGEHCFIESGVKIGDRVTIKNGVSVWDRVNIRNDVFVGPNAVFTNDLYPISRVLDRKKERFKDTLIKNGVCVGANSTVVCGITLNEHSFIGAGAVVVNDLPRYALAYGNPAKVKGFICSCRRKLKFKGKTAKCLCGKKFGKSSKYGIMPL